MVIVWEEKETNRATLSVWSDMHRSPAGSVFRLPNLSNRHATTGGRHQQLLYRFIRFIATSYHHAIYASHADRRMANHAMRSRLCCLQLPMAEEDIYSTRQRREGAAPPAQRHGPRSASCQLRGTFVLTGSGTGGRRGNSVQLQETASHDLPEKHKRATVVRQFGQKLLQLLKGGLVLEHARRLVSLTRRRPHQR
jgi:hypothetical protein